MKLDGRSVAWIVVAAVLTVLTINMLMSLASDARAMFFGIAVGVVIVVAVAYLFLHRPRDINDEYDEFVRVEQAGARRQKELAAAFERGRDHAAYRRSLGDPEYMPTEQPPVVQEVHYHYHVDSVQQQGTSVVQGRR